MKTAKYVQAVSNWPGTEGLPRPGIFHLEGTDWLEAPVPRRWHRCWSQSIGLMPDGMWVHRCACGAISNDGKFWMERNRRRQK
jgi:hypothetical protein